MLNTAYLPIMLVACLIPMLHRVNLPITLVALQVDAGVKARPGARHKAGSTASKEQEARQRYASQRPTLDICLSRLLLSRLMRA